MKKTTARKTLIAMLAAAMCATGAVIPTSANVELCSSGHNWYHASHGSYVDHGTDRTYCYNINYYQCVYRCFHTGCSASTMMNHHEYQEHQPIYKDSSDGVIHTCSLCGYLF